MDFQTICRVCTLENLEMVSIFESHNFSAHNYEISKIITDCASVQIQKLDGFSQQICRRCLDHLSQAYSFKRLCEDSDYKFRNDLIVSTKMEIKDEFSAEDTKIIFGETDNYCITKNTDETIKITHIGLTQVQKEPINDVIETNNHPDNQNETDGEEQPLASLSNDVLESINSEESPILMNSHCTRCKISLAKSSRKLKFFPHKCQYCNKSYAQKNTLITHIKHVHPEQHPYKCSVCSKEFRQYNLLAHHMRTHREKKPFVCHVCGKIFTQKLHLLNHLELHSGEERSYQCGICSKKFAYKCNLNNHIKVHIRRRKRKKCNICGKLITSALKVHMRTHTGERPFKCEICNKAFTQNSALKTHIVLHTGEQPYKCDICGKTFASKQNLSTHAKIHKDKTSYKCDFCDKTYTTRNNLKTHIREHTGELYNCDFCCKKFTTTNALIAHIRTHTGEKPYKCEFCDKTFALSSNLQSHVRTHTGEKPFKCHLCDKQFTLSTTLTVHIRTHTGEKPFKCDICDKKFISRSTMTRHSMRLHPRQ